MGDPWWARLLVAVPDDVGCDAVFEALDRYVDAVLRGEEVSAAYAGLLVHLRSCVACREDVEGLVFVMQGSGGK